MSQLVQLPNSVGSITVIDGCMFAGKSGTLIHEANTIYRQNIPVKIFAPDMSRRELSEKDRIKSHDGVVPLCDSIYLPIDGLFEACLATDLPFVICIDEAQFFKDLIKTCVELRLRGVTVIVAGLALTSNRTPFGEMHALLDRADTVVKRKTVCSFCKRYGATLSFRTCSNKDEICVGAEKEYVPACQLCFDARFEK